jgi:hypothetical protein
MVTDFGYPACKFRKYKIELVGASSTKFFLMKLFVCGIVE